MTTGVGFAPIGTSPAGLGAPVESPVLAAAGYQLSTTGAVSSVNIDPITHDYTYDAYGNEEGMSDTGQRMMICLSTVAESRTSFRKSGLARPRTVGDNILTEVKEAIRVATLPVTSDGSAAILDVQVETEGTSVFALVQWKDLRRGTIQQPAKVRFG